MLWHSPPRTEKPSKETLEIHARLLAKHAHRYPHGIPKCISALLYANARFIVLRGKERDSAWGAKLMRQRMAKATHKAIRAKGMEPCQAANEARKRYSAERKARKAGQTQAELRTGSSNLDGI